MAAEETKPAGNPDVNANPNANGVMGMNMWLLIAVIAIVVVVAVIAAILMSSPAPPVGPSTGNTTPPVTPPVTDNNVPLTQIMAGTPEALANIKQMTVRGDMNMDVSMPQQGTSSASANIDLDYDVANQSVKMMMDIAQSSPGTPETTQTIDAYIIDGMMYSKTKTIQDGEEVIDPTMGNEWVKQPLGEAMSLPSAENITKMLSAFKGQVVGTETVNGQSAKKIKLEPDLENIFTSELMAEAGLSGVDVDEMIGMIQNSLTKFDVYVWMSEDTSLPIKIDGDVSFDVDLSELYGGLLSGAMTADITLNTDIDYATPVVVSLPAEAANATDLYDMIDLGNYTNDLAYV